MLVQRLVLFLPVHDPIDLLVDVGDRGEDVKWVQHHLARHGFKVVVDGVAGRKTERAIRSFQRRSGLIADAIVGSRTRAALSS